jgi:hypothetical protein
MTRTCLGLLVVAWLALPGQAQAGSNTIAKALGNLRWGMSEREVTSALKGKTDVKALERSRIEFDGDRSRFDNTMIGEEYTHGNDETALTFKDKDSENYLFFIGGELWKWVKVYPASAFGTKFTTSVKKKFGKGYEKEGEVNPGSGAVYSYIELNDRNTRLRAVDKSESHRAYVLMFESLDTARSIASLRGNTIRRGTPAKKAAAVAKRPSADEEDEGDSRSASRTSNAPSAPGTLASAGKSKKSIFSGEQRDETDEEYSARKAKLVADQRNQARRTHERSEETKKGKILDELAEIDDEDPISGMGK